MIGLITDSQKCVLKRELSLGLNYVAKDKAGKTYFYTDKPCKGKLKFFCSNGGVRVGGFVNDLKNLVPQGKCYRTKALLHGIFAPVYCEEQGLKMLSELSDDTTLIVDDRDTMSKEEFIDYLNTSVFYHERYYTDKFEVIVERTGEQVEIDI